MRLLKLIRKYKRGLILIAVASILILISPLVYGLQLKQEQKAVHVISFNDEFPVTVDPINKQIIEDEKVNTYLNSQGSPLQATAIQSFSLLKDLFAIISVALAKTSFYNSLALAGGDTFVKIYPGLRKEEVANSFGKALGWNSIEKNTFLTPQKNSSLPFLEGSFAPGVYIIEKGSTPEDVQELVNKRFRREVLSRYGTTTEEMVPLSVALTIASLIQRETIGTEDMRLVSGIIWNRIFKNMSLQLDASLQYVKANNRSVSVWWPVVLPRDKYLKSPYNTYQNKGLPPGPIANPSVAAIVAALNPLKTDCLFYFHDSLGNMHCTETYEDHVSLLKQKYGRGK